MAERIQRVPAKVEDIAGLYMDLRRAGFAVRNIGVDSSGTSVFLESAEERDPTEIVMRWEGKKAPPLSDHKAWADRAAEMKTIASRPPEPTIAARPKRPSIISRIFRRLY